MKKMLALLFFTSCLSFVYAGNDASLGLIARYPYKSASWKSTTTIQSPEEKVSYEQTVFIKGKKMRTEGQFLNRATNEINNQIIIIDGASIFSINPEKKQGMKYSLKNPNNPSKTADTKEGCRNTAKNTGYETLDGVKCGIYEYSCKSGDTEIKAVEYRNISGFAIKTVLKTGGTLTTVTTRELEENARIPDSKFIPDKDIKFMDMDSMTDGDIKKMTKPAEDFEKNKEALKIWNETPVANGKNDSGDAGGKIFKDVMKNMGGQ